MEKKRLFGDSVKKNVDEDDDNGIINEESGFNGDMSDPLEEEKKSYESLAQKRPGNSASERHGSDYSRPALSDIFGSMEDDETEDNKENESFTQKQGSASKTSVQFSEVNESSKEGKSKPSASAKMSFTQAQQSASQLNSLILQHSTASLLVILPLPHFEIIKSKLRSSQSVGDGDDEIANMEDEERYMRYVDLITANLNNVILVRGSGDEVCFIEEYIFNFV
jgi:hypothetical protein